MAASVVSVISLKFSDVSYLWIGSSWCTVFVSCAVLFPSNFVRIVSINSAVVVLTLSGVESYYYFLTLGSAAEHDESRNLAGEPVRRAETHGVLGWAPSAAGVVSWTRYHGEEPIFDVTYEVDEHGLRVSNPKSDSRSSECMLFFGGSFMFGAGVEDSETLPYRVASLSAGGLRSHNFGYAGYGPQQMLAALEHGIVDNAIDCEPRYVIYQGIVDHIRRVANKTRWTDNAGPRYLLDENGIATYEGQFDQPTVRDRLFSQLRKSYAVRALIELFVTSADIERMVAVVDSSRDWTEAHYPDSEFHVLFWDQPGSASSEAVVNQLLDREINLHLITEIIPDFYTDKLNYVLSVHDPHPNAATNARMAEYVATRITNPVVRTMEQGSK